MINSITPLKFNNEVVATYSVLADFLGAEERRLSENFKRNLDRFVEGKHYFKLSHDNAQSVVPNYQGFKGLTVWTEQGCARHSKILQTDEAWELWEDMEETYFSTKKITLLPDFSNPAVAARAWAEQYETAQLAISTKAEIGSRREATAMNTASQAVKKANKLEIKLDQSKQFCTVKRMEMLKHGQKFSWQLLKSTGIEMGINSIDVFDANYGTVKAYHVDVWYEAYAINLAEAS